MRLLRMINLLALIVIISRYGHCAALQINDEKLIVSLYYESLCPDCIEFISNQISRAFTSIGSHFELEFVPYGNAKTLPTSPPTFQCQHGPNECDGNKMHACAIKYLPSTAITQFIICTMSTKDPPNAGPECARSLYVDFSPIESCISTGEGDQLMYNYGQQTDKLNPAHQYVPWILFDGQFNEDDNQRAGTDLVRVICTKLRHPPDACNSVHLV